MDNEILITLLKTVDSMVTKTNEINKRLVIAIISICLVFCITAVVVSGYYFIGQGYPDTTQTITQDEIKQTVTKGSD